MPFLVLFQALQLIGAKQQLAFVAAVNTKAQLHGGGNKLLHIVHL